MSDKNLRAKLVRLAYQKPELRGALMPLLNTAKKASLNVASVTWDELVAAYLLETAKQVANLLGEAEFGEILDHPSITLVYYNMAVGTTLYSIEIDMTPMGLFQVKLVPSDENQHFGSPEPKFEFSFRQDVARPLKPAALARTIATKLKPYL